MSGGPRQVAHDHRFDGFEGDPKTLNLHCVSSLLSLSTPAKQPNSIYKDFSSQHAPVNEQFIK